MRFSGGEMKISEGMPGPNSTVLQADGILKYFLGTDDDIDTLIKCKPSSVELVCLDQSLYEALGSLKDYDEFDFRKLVKFLEAVEIISYKFNLKRGRPVLTETRVEELRTAALAKNNHQLGGN
jgi:hypothetical protein